MMRCVPARGLMLSRGKGVYVDFVFLRGDWNAPTLRPAIATRQKEILRQRSMNALSRFNSRRSRVETRAKRRYATAACTRPHKAFRSRLG